MSDVLESRLLDLGRAVAFPTASEDLPARVGDRIRARQSWWTRLGFGPIRRSLVVALAALLLAAAAVAAAGIILPGLRIVFLQPGATLSPAPTAGAQASPSVDSVIGARLGLGSAVTLEDAARVAGFEPLIPRGLGPPDEVYLAAQRMTLLWGARPDLPEIQPGVGLLITEFRGSVDPGYYEKQVSSGVTRVEEVSVGGDVGYWLDGEPHGLVYRDASGAFVEESRRLVGDVLIWSQDGMTFRIESGLGRDATIELAESLAPTTP